MSLKIITILLFVCASTAAFAHGQHGDVEDLPPPPKMEATSEASVDMAQPVAAENSDAKVEESKPQAAKPDPQ